MNIQERIGESIYNTYKSMAYLVERIGEKKIARRLASPNVSPEEKASLKKRKTSLWRDRERRRSETSPNADIEVSKKFHRDRNVPDTETPDQEKRRVSRYKDEVRIDHQRKRTADHEARRGIKTRGL